MGMRRHLSNMESSPKKRVFSPFKLYSIAPYKPKKYDIKRNITAKCYSSKKIESTIQMARLGMLCTRHAMQANIVFMTLPLPFSIALRSYSPTDLSTSFNLEQSSF